LNSYYSGLRNDHSREQFKAMTVAEVMTTLTTHQSLRTEIKQNNDPWVVALHLQSFNIDYAQSLGLFLNITDACKEELAAGFQVYAQKPQ